MSWGGVGCLWALATCLDGASWQSSCHLLCNRANSVGGKGVFPRCEHPHDKLKQTGSDFEVVVEEDAAKKWSEEAVNDGIREAFFLHNNTSNSTDDLQVFQPIARYLPARMGTDKL